MKRMVGIVVSGKRVNPQLRAVLPPREETALTFMHTVGAVRRDWVVQSRPELLTFGGNRSAGGVRAVVVDVPLSSVRGVYAPYVDI